MIPRYTNPEMGRLWSDEHRFESWLRVEIAVMRALGEKGIIPADAAGVVEAKAGIDLERITRLEETLKHDVIAFTTSIAEQVGEPARFFHYGVTSSDIIDTALALVVGEAGEIILAGIDRLREVLGRRALEHRRTVMVGRTHGIHAEPTTLGLKFALWYEETARARERVEASVRDMRFGKVSGSVGTFAHLGPEIEERVCELLGVKPAPVSTQIIQRDRHAAFIAALALLGCTMEKIAVEIRGLQRTDIREAEEEFTGGQKGSSSMPHKRNPIGSENISGLARLLRANAIAAMENVALWHERDISHSSVERVIFPDSCILADYMLRRLTKILDRLVVYPERMLENLDLTKGLVYSQAVMLALVRKGATREEAYAAVQRNAMRCWEEKRPLKDLLAADAGVSAILSARELDDLFDPHSMLRNIDAVFKRVFGEGE
jgi:adenylosuccinate lyase